MITHLGAKMSKSKGNAISPSAYVERYGADTARCYILFLGPPAQDADWSDSGVGGVYRFLSRVWRLGHTVPPLDVAPESFDPAGLEGAALELVRKSHWAIDKVTGDIERFQFNTAIAALMELVNDVYREMDALGGDEAGARALSFAAVTTASLLFPFAPHLASELAEALAGARVWEMPWPHADEGLLRRDTVTMVVQVNGKVRDSIEVAADEAREAVESAAREAPNVQRHLGDREVEKVVLVPGRLVNFVVR
jgi:leucyl-tRNA synthetase